LATYPANRQAIEQLVGSGSPMWSITSYYNPVRYKRRLSNYKLFRKNLASPLVTVELSFDGNFELNKDDADILIQISGGAIIWQKERLLNLAVKSVPSHEEYVSWIDCDAIFERPDWLDEATTQLKSHKVVQLFSDQIDLAPEEDYGSNLTCHDTPPSGHGIVSLITNDRFRQSDVTSTSGRNRRSFAWGLAWAARREILENHGLYDAMIAGGGTRALVSAMYGDFQKVIEAVQFNAAQREHYLKWALPYHKAVDKHVGHLTGRLYHLWHGDIENRNYAGRHSGLVESNFDPNADIVIGSNGAWQWARSKPELERFLKNFFISRAEDG
jgi:hypothetical protein